MEMLVACVKHSDGLLPLRILTFVLDIIVPQPAARPGAAPPKGGDWGDFRSKDGFRLGAKSSLWDLRAYI